MNVSDWSNTELMAATTCVQLHARNKETRAVTFSKELSYNKFIPMHNVFQFNLNATHIANPKYVVAAFTLNFSPFISMRNGARLLGLYAENFEFKQIF